MNQMAQRQNPWLRSGAWDVFWMLSGLWLLLPIAGFSGAPTALKVMLIGATALLWLSHRFATTYNAFCMPAYRQLLGEQRDRFVILPAVIIIATFAFVFSPESVMRLNLWGRVQILATIFFLYNSYHFGIQHYGVLSIYRIRAGQGHSGWLKRYEKFFAIAVGTIVVALAQMCHGAEVVADSLVYNVVPREVFSVVFGVLQKVAPLLVLGLAGIFYAGEFRNTPVSIPKVLYVGGLALQGILAYFLEPISFLILWGVQHWLVSVALGAHMADNDASEVPAGSWWYGMWARFNKGFWPTVFILVLASIVLTPFFELAVHPYKVGWAPGVLSTFGSMLGNSWATKLFIALNFISVYIHFVMDRAVFRFSDPAVRKISVPLLFKPVG